VKIEEIPRDYAAEKVKTNHWITWRG